MPDDFGAFLREEDDSPKLEDLPYWWDRTPPDEVDPDLPTYPRRITMLASYLNWQRKKRWAWDGLQKLLVTLLDRGEPIPELLQLWAYRVAAGRSRRPRHSSTSERDRRIMMILQFATNRGFGKGVIAEEIADALGLDIETIRSIIKKEKKASPFG